MRGFSLVELSIVLVILGLLTGGILAGQSLIRAAELRAVVSEVQKYSIATLSFNDQYLALPGDISNATAYWGALDGGDGLGADCFTVESTDQRTCNGNEDGIISFPQGTTSSSVWYHGERYHAWLQLSSAGLIEGSYTGRTDSTTSKEVNTIGKNVPQSKMSSQGWLLAWIEHISSSSHAQHFQGNGGKNLLSFIPSAGGSSSALRPKELWKIDGKLDDGAPATGRIYTAKKTSTYGPDCATTDLHTTAEYDLASDVPCYVIIEIE